MDLCKKCGSKLIADFDHMRANCKGGDVPQISAQVHRCITCGWRYYPEIAVVMPLTKDITGKFQQMDRGTRVSEHILVTIKRFYPDIKWLRKSNTAWKTIANLITQATGRPIKADTIIKYYMMIEKEGNIHGVQGDPAAKPGRTEPVPVGKRQQLAAGIRR